MAVVTSSQTLRKLRGELRLTFESGAAHDTVLTERFRRGLYHFSKPYREDRRLILQLLNPTAGLFSGDHAEAHVTVGESAQACLLAPSSTQVYAMPDGGWASSAQHFRVARGGSLVFQPRWAVLHKDARLCQRTHIHLDNEASLLFIDHIAAGRKAHGEFLEFAQILNHLELFRGEKLVLRERLACGNADRRWIWNCRGEPRAFYTTAIVSTPTPLLNTRASFIALEEAKDPHTHLGLSELESGLYVLRILSSSNCMISSLLQLFCSFLPMEITLPELSKRIH